MSIASIVSTLFHPIALKRHPKLERQLKKILSFFVSTLFLTGYVCVKPGNVIHRKEDHYYPLSQLLRCSLNSFTEND